MKPVIGVSGEISVTTTAQMWDAGYFWDSGLFWDTDIVTITQGAPVIGIVFNS